MNFSSLKYNLSVILKQKTVLPCVNFIRREKGYGRWDLMLTLPYNAFNMAPDFRGRLELRRILMDVTKCRIWFNRVSRKRRPRKRRPKGKDLENEKT